MPREVAACGDLMFLSPPMTVDMRPLKILFLGAGLVGLACLVEAGNDKEAASPKVRPRAAAAAAPQTKSPAAPAVKPTKAAPPLKDEAAEKSVRASAEEFAQAYNRHDAETLANGFTVDGEMIAEDGTRIDGRDAIRNYFVALFETHPEAQVTVKIESIKMITADVAVEEGVIDGSPVPGDLTQRSLYVALHVKRDGKWQVVRARDYRDETPSGISHAPLTQLEWLVGDWGHETEDVFVHSTYKWSPDGNFLLQDFDVHFAGRQAVVGSTRIAWDPLHKRFRSWTFDANGGFSEAFWTRAGDEWLIRNSGINHLGQEFSSTSILRKVSPTSLSWETRDRIEGGVATYDQGPILVHRDAPPPAAE